MTAKFRLPQGGRIDRTAPLRFRFNGEELTGYEGDTLASALLAHGRNLVGRSLKRRRPRGILTAGVEEPNAIIQLRRGSVSTPNLQATTLPLFEGLEASSVRGWPGPRFDLFAFADRFPKLLAAGFYYKTFMPSLRAWARLYEPIIRAGAGLGRVPDSEMDPDIYDHTHLYCDVLVIGAGPAGVEAAWTAATAGARVMLIDEQTEIGGGLLSAKGAKIDGQDALERTRTRAARIAEIARNAGGNAQILINTTLFGYYHHNYLCALERRAGKDPSREYLRLHHIRAGQVVLATGAHERPLVFADNDRPGIMLAGAASCYIHRYAVAPGRRAVLFANHDAAYDCALDLLGAGITLAAIIDPRPAGRPPRADAMADAITKRIKTLDIPILTGHAISRVVGTSRLRAVEAHKLTLDGKRFHPGEAQHFACDLLAISGGWSPAIHLFSQSQGKITFDRELGGFKPARAREATHWAGSLGGIFDLAGSIRDGARAGGEASRAAGFSPVAEEEPQIEAQAPGTIVPYWQTPTLLSRDQESDHFVDFQNDTTVADLRLAAREGFDSVELMKRYTLAGFGSDQGRTGNINALAILAEITGRTIEETGTTTFRPPYTPVPLAALAGRRRGTLFDATRRTLIHNRHVASGAVFEPVGQWLRPWYYPQNGETMHEAVTRECASVRAGAGLLDASTLGKIDIQGPDAITLLNRAYINEWSKLPVGAARYGVMCGEDGMAIDDGVTARLGEHHYLMTTTTGGAAGVFDRLEEYLQTEWPELRVRLQSVTEQWANVTLAGPAAREILRKLAPGIDLSPSGFPFMRFREGKVAGIKARIFRISFSGELSFEIHVEACYGPALWDALWEEGTPHGIVPYGTEAMHVLRAEKGFIIIGQETDGSVTPLDLGMGRMISATKGDFIGKRSLARIDLQREARKQLVGLLTRDPRHVLPEGAQITATDATRPPVPMLGHVTSSYWSPACGRSIALALVQNGRKRYGETLYASLDEGGMAPVTIVEPVFYDPKGLHRDG